MKRRRIKLDARQIIKYCYEKVFESCQLCAWYALYAPEYLNLPYESAVDFSKFFSEKDKKYANNVEEYEAAKADLLDETGIDVHKEAKKVSMAARLKMCGVTLGRQEAAIAVGSMELAVIGTIFLSVKGMLEGMKMSLEQVQRFLECFQQIANEYGHGLTDKTMRKYFEELEGWTIHES